jgi:hypothetical protein
VVDIIDVTPLGGVVVGGATNETVNILQFILIKEFALKARGHPVPADENPQYPRGVTVNNLTTGMDAGSGFNEWLTPCWVMLFSATKTLPPNELEAAKNASIWVKQFNSTADLQKIVLPAGIAAGFLKIQLSGYGSLCLAEVQVHVDKLNYLKYYERGNPIAASTITHPFQAGQPLDPAFQYADMNGMWYLRVQQNLEAGSSDPDGGGWDGAYGSLSDYVLLITDLSGTVHTFYQNLVGEILSLPKHGALYLTGRGNSSYWDFQEAFEVDPLNRIEIAEGAGRPLGLCFKDATCSVAAGKGPLLDDKHLYGESPQLNFLHNERVVVYVPDEGYLGPDFFTYAVRQGSNLQQHVSRDGSLGSVNEVTMHVRRCRRYQQELYSRFNSTTHPLCVCAFNSSATITTIAGCTGAVVSVCAAGNSYREAFANMCEACQLHSTATALNASAIISGECSVEIYRAVWFATDRGLCSSAPRMDCSTETYTDQGSDARNYLSLKQPLLHGSISALGNSFGGYGWFDSSTL